MLKVSSRADFEALWGVQMKFFRSEIFFADSHDKKELFLKKSPSYHDGVSERISRLAGGFSHEIKDLVSGHRSPERPNGSS